MPTPHCSDSRRIHITLRPLLKPAVLFCLIGLALCFPAIAQDQPAGEAADSVITKRSKQNFLDRVGFFANVDGGYSSRVNWYTTYKKGNIPVDYASPYLNVLNLHLRTGLAGVEFVDFDYQRSFPNNEFQEEALSFRTDQTSGLRKYTLGIDTTPLWLLILPEEASGIVKRLLSLRFRTFRALTQTTARVTENSLRAPDGGTIGNYSDPSSYEPIANGTSYSFKTRYRYKSVSFPLLLFQQNTGHLNVGVAQWRFSRSYAASIPEINNNTQVIFDASVKTLALTAELYISLPDDLKNAYGEEIPEGWEGVEVEVIYGYGIQSEWSSPDVNLDRLFFPSGDQQLDITNHNYEVRASYPFTLLEDVNSLDVSLRVGVMGNTFTTSFGNFKDSEDITYEHAEDAKSTFHKRDWIVKPWLRFSLSY